MPARLRGLITRNHGTWRGAVRTLLGELEYVSGRLSRHIRLPAQRPQRLVFVCLGNINRSAFAEQVARQLGQPCCSIGLSTRTGGPATAQARATAPHFGLSLDAHRATDYSDYRYQAGDLLLVMEVRHVGRLIQRGVPAEAILLLGHWASPQRIHLHDPHTLSDAYFRTCFTLIESAVRGLVAALPADAKDAR